MNIDIGQMPLGKKPPGFTEALTGQGEAVSWRVLDDPSAPAGKVIAETSRDTADYRFPLCIYDGLSAKDVEVAIRFRAVDGSVDQAAGIVARLQDAGNYYVARANALEDNVRLYKVVNGVRRQIAGQNLQVALAVWHALIFKIVGETIEVWFNAARLIQVRDQTLLAPGKVGMWTKADSLTHFAEMRIESRQAGVDRVITDL
jgi:hypothetical protein